jgi:hypothetical protein
MKRLFFLLLSLLILVTHEVSGEILSATVTASDNHNVGSILAGGYTGTPDSGNDVIYEWFLSPSGTSLGTNSTYTIVSGNQGAFVYLTATEVDGDDNIVRSFSTTPVRVNSYPSAGSLSVSGTLRVGKTILANYSFTDIDGDTEGATEINWYRDTDGTGSSWIGPIGTGKTFELTNSEFGRLIRFTVRPVAMTGSPAGALVTSPNSGPILNPPPTAIVSAITGGINVNDVLTGNYTYSDGEGDIEGSSIFEWWRSTSSLGTPQTKISGASSRSYQLQLSDAGQYIIFKVTPVAQSGVLTGSQVSSPVFGRVNSAPYASAVSIGGTPAVDVTLTGLYQFNDVDNDAEGSSIFKWYRDGIIITDATSFTYVVTNDDIGSSLEFEYTPVAASGLPNVGVAVRSAPKSVPYPSGHKPVASMLCISGTRAVGSELTGDYTFTDTKFKEQNSRYFWFRGSSRVPLATTRNYHLVAGDIESDIIFAVIPRNNKGVEGDTAFSAPLAIINPIADRYIVTDPDVVLEARPINGYFHGDGVIGGRFSPGAAGEGGPYTVRYTLNIYFPGRSCIQNATRSVTVEPVSSFFTGFNDIYCHDGGNDTIHVSNLPGDAVIPADPFRSTNLNGIITVLPNKTSVVINPGRMRHGINVDSLFFTYNSGGSQVTLKSGFVIDSVGASPSFANLDTSYCEASARKFISVLGVYPAGGTAVWTGLIISEPEATSAFVDPVKGSANNDYLVQFTYTSPLGCTSQTVERLVHINPLPDATFPLKAIYNVDGPAETLVPATPGGLFTGPGISGYTFYPEIAGQGTHRITYNVTDTKGCSSASSENTEVKKAAGLITGINPGNQYCYDGPADTIRFQSTETWFGGLFSGAGIINTGAGEATFTPAVAGTGDHQISFSFRDSFFTPFVITQTLKVDSVGQVTIENLTPGAVFCNGDAPFPLYTNREGGSFTGPVTINSFDPSKGPGTTPVIYTFVNTKTGCASSVTVPVTINATPQVAFTVADVCIETSNDTTRFINSSISADPVANWLWQFRDGGGVMISENETAGYLYTTGGLHQITLTATTVKNCSSSLQKTIDLGVKPVAGFYWLNECFHPDDSVRIFDNTTGGSPVTSRAWNFFDGKPPLTDKDPRYPKLSEGYIPVEYIVYTNYANCYDTIRKEIFIRPTIELSAADEYYETFEAGPGGWIADQGINETWRLGIPDRPEIDRAASGENAWFTDFDILSQRVQSSSVSSPCFDFTGTERPMISMKLWRRFDRNRDGSALQYQIGDNPSWEYLGTIDDGINWYNSTLINGRPGGDRIGWTTGTMADTMWIEARHRLDELIGRRDVKFRIAYGSDGTAQDNDGIAFDDVRISARSRNVLFEHFTNSSSQAVIRANGIVNTIVNAMPDDIINIRYHTNFPGTDQFYLDNPSDMSARVLFYGLSKVPYSFTDGGTGLQFAGVFDYLVADAEVNTFIKRSLINPPFIIDVAPVISDGVLVVNTEINALEDITASNMTLYVSVTAKEITNITGSNGEVNFRNVLRKMLPDAGGTNLTKSWTKNQTFSPEPFTWIVGNLYNAKDIEVIAFIQNNITREVYQAASSKITDYTVGVTDVAGANAGFTVYPNPTGGRMVLSLDEPARSGTMIELLNFRGIVVKSFRAKPGDSIVTIDDLGLPEGIYIVRVASGGMVSGLRKLIISAR